jgi:polysaccharide export outer membrane protein
MEIPMIKIMETTGISNASIQKRIVLVSILWMISSVSPVNIFALPQEKALPVTDYRIGAKDLLEIKILELPELNQTVRVLEDGSISFSLIGKVDVAGLTALELEKKLASILNKQYTKDAHVSVIVKEFQKVAVIGAVGRPAMYELAGTTTLLQVIAQAGGLTAQTTDELFIFRKDNAGLQIRIAVKLADLIIKGNPDLNIEIQPKDVISIPIDLTQHVFIYGEVKAPGVIPFLSSKRITLLQAIAQAGGPTDWAKPRGVIIKRKDKKTGKEIKIPVNLNAVISGKTSDPFLEEGDIVIVP